MAFIVKKKIHGKEYYYLNENKRIDGKVKTKTLAYLGKDRKDAERLATEFIEKKKMHVEIKEEPREKFSIEDLASFCKRKGFVYPSGEIYGGLAGFWDFGPLGVELLNNIKREWWNYFVRERANVSGIEASIISPSRTWKASGHITNFTDISVKCTKCKKFNKIDRANLDTAICSFCGGKLDKSTAKDLNLMFKTNAGPVEDDSIHAYLRGETAQGMFIDFKLIQQTSRMQLPFGYCTDWQVF